MQQRYVSHMCNLNVYRNHVKTYKKEIGEAHFKDVLFIVIYLNFSSSYHLIRKCFTLLY